MHLFSFLSDGYFSDSVADAPDLMSDQFESFGRTHRDGLIRGALFVLALATPLILTVALSPAQSSKDRAPEAASQIRITHIPLKTLGLD